MQNSWKLFLYSSLSLRALTKPKETTNKPVARPAGTSMSERGIIISKYVVVLIAKYTSARKDKLLWLALAINSLKAEHPILSL